jgi:uncharacterized delta-60 repeat protein
MSRLTHRRTFTATLVATLALFFCAASVHAAPGDLDLSFGPSGTGRAEYSFNSVGALARAAAIQSDGKIILAGTCGFSNTSEICVLRISPDGTPDAAFGNQGRVMLGSATTAEAFALALQRDGKLVLSGRCRDVNRSERACAIRLHNTGALDTSFGTNGQASAQIALNAGAVYAIASVLQSDGRIVTVLQCGANSSSPQFCAIRFHTNGALDTSFGAGGLSLVPTNLDGAVANSAALVEGDKIVIFGHCNDARRSSGVDFCAVRLLASGQLDTSFASQGIALHAIGASASTDYSSDVIVQPDGKLVLVGSCEPDTYRSFCMLRLDPSGNPDPSFGQQGKVALPQDQQQFGRSGGIQRDGKLLVAGDCRAAGTVGAPHFCFTTYNSDGSLDGAIGRVVSPLPGEQYALDALMLNDGNILLVGGCLANNRYAFCANRYQGGAAGNTLCSLDIDGDGVLNPAIDGLILARATLGFTGSAVYAGIAFPANAKRTRWGTADDADIRKFLVAQCGMMLN